MSGEGETRCITDADAEATEESDARTTSTATTAGATTAAHGATLRPRIWRSGRSSRRRMRRSWKSTRVSAAVIDERHGAEVLELLDELPLTPPQLDLLGTSTLTALAQLTTFMDRLVQFADTVKGAGTLVRAG